eukprot:CAMPEP_0118924610 /NCGR_PEP_ID=MMETSP1169-20130426/2669_1 /TAXON_ID=36882 /ORGANISM="Pyramimonas obovata, Strain CCMP722" /LENGTH=1006 /DNA_ID=CAMNT_0006865737 /DNA_START=118 /DNA_END=3134 /DNA_ORIENTATION=+
MYSIMDRLQTFTALQDTPLEENTDEETPKDEAPTLVGDRAPRITEDSIQYSDSGCSTPPVGSGNPRRFQDSMDLSLGGGGSSSKGRLSDRARAGRYSEHTAPVGLADGRSPRFSDRIPRNSDEGIEFRSDKYRFNLRRPSTLSTEEEPAQRGGTRAPLSQRLVEFKATGRQRKSSVVEIGDGAGLISKSSNNFRRPSTSNRLAHYLTNTMHPKLSVDMVRSEVPIPRKSSAILRGEPMARKSSMHGSRRSSALSTNKVSAEGELGTTEEEEKPKIEWQKARWQAAITKVTLDMEPKEKTAGSKFAAVVVAAAKAESAKQLLSAARMRHEEESRKREAQQSRVSGLSGGYLYFIVLENSWYYSIIFALVAYGLSIVFGAVIALPLDLHNTTAEYEQEHGYPESTQWNLALRFAAAHMITIGFGPVLPLSPLAHAVASFQQLFGMIINVFVFAAVVAKFQRPVLDLTWAKNAVVLKRDNRPALLIRVANLRCHTLYNPNLRLTMLTRWETAEGESYVRKVALEVLNPATIAGVHTITHVIHENTPLWHWLAAGDAENAEELLLHVTFSALDPVYGAEVCGNMTYSNDTIRRNSKYQDVIKISDEGRVQIDWGQFNNIIPAPGARLSEMLDDGEETPPALRSPLDLSVQAGSVAPGGEGAGGAETELGQLGGSPVHQFQSQSFPGLPRQSRSYHGVAHPFFADLSGSPGGGSVHPPHVGLQDGHGTPLSFCTPSRMSSHNLDGQFPEPCPIVGDALPGLPRLAMLSARASYSGTAADPLDWGAALGPIMPICNRSVSVALLLAEAEFPFEPVLINGFVGTLPAWYTELVPSGMCPSMQGLEPVGGPVNPMLKGILAYKAREEGKAPEEDKSASTWVEGFESLSMRLNKNKKVSALRPKGAKPTAYLLRLGEKMIYGTLVGRLRDSTVPNAMALLNEFMANCGVKDKHVSSKGKAAAQATIEEDAPLPSTQELCTRCADAALDALREADRILTEAREAHAAKAAAAAAAA